MKLKRSPVWIAFIIMPIIPAVMGTINYCANLELLTSEWDSLWTQHTLFTCYFFLPIMIGVYCTYLMRLEYANHNQNKLLSMPVSRTAVFISKLITVSYMILLTELWIGVLFIISGILAGLNSPPLGKLALWCMFGSLGGVVMAAAQLILSIFIKSFALPVGIAFAGGLSGLVFLSKDLGNIWFYSLMAYGMSSNAPQQISSNGYAGYVITCIAYIAVFAALGSIILSNTDV